MSCLTSFFDAMSGVKNKQFFSDSRLRIYSLVLHCPHGSCASQVHSVMCGAAPVSKNSVEKFTAKAGEHIEFSEGWSIFQVICGPYNEMFYYVIIAHITVAEIFIDDGVLATKFRCIY